MPLHDQVRDVQAPCPACSKLGLTFFYDVLAAPTTSNLLMSSREEARRWPRGHVRLGFCEACGFITNTDFDPQTQQLDQRYQATQACSPTFGAFAQQLAQSWINRYGLRGKHILEIGCGGGEFLRMICDLAGATGIGVDPIAPSGTSDHRIKLVPAKLDAQHFDRAVDFVICRHTLEHIPDVGQFLAGLAAALRSSPGAVVAIEVPDTMRVLKEAAFWDIYYEHCSYFTTGTLARTLVRGGFDILRHELAYGGQYLVMECAIGPRTRSRVDESVDDLKRALEEFKRSVSSANARWLALLLAGRRTVVWGSGSKAVGFLTTLGITDEVIAVVDINPAKHGTFLPGSGHEIVAPERLRELRPDVVIVMNLIYVDEIRQSLTDLGLTPEVVALR